MNKSDRAQAAKHQERVERARGVYGPLAARTIAEERDSNEPRLF